MMSICFFDANPNENSGSYRIWVKDLCLSLNEAGVKSRITHSFDELEKAPEDIIIFSKSSYKSIPKFKKNKEKIIGAINVSADDFIPSIDFVIVGSHEERISLSSYDNVFLYPLIERKFMRLPRKVHKNKEIFKICFHGHHPHLFKFYPHLRDSIEEIDKLRKVKLNIVTGTHDVDSWWKKESGRPDVDIEFHEYDKISKVVHDSDVGVVPNVIDLKGIYPGLVNQTSSELGMYSTDYIYRIKNKTNPGRAFVFYQHGIPVIHDMSPSSFEMMAFTGIYDLAHDKKSWVNCFKKYLDQNYRQEVSDRFRTKFEKKYNPVTWAEKLYIQIREIQNDY
tara:strand:- start:81 stop:1088 length:1008 start_codon:yes stop_codon:yes gene_type:complete